MIKFFAKVNKQTGIVEETRIADQMYIWDLPDFEDWFEFKMDGSIRKNPAAIGYKYDKERDAFIPSKPFESWVLNEETCQWETPIPKPSLDSVWDEETISWKTME